MNFKHRNYPCTPTPASQTSLGIQKPMAVPQRRLLRAMNTTDLEQVMDIEQTIYTHPWTRGNFSDALQAGYLAWVLEMTPKIVGYALVMRAVDEAHLLNIGIDKNEQKKGFGRYLLSEIMAQMRQSEVWLMFLEVRVSNQLAIALYQSLGFNEMAVRRDYYRTLQGGYEDALLMGCQL